MDLSHIERTNVIVPFSGTRHGSYTFHPRIQKWILAVCPFCVEDVSNAFVFLWWHGDYWAFFFLSITAELIPHRTLISFVISGFENWIWSRNSQDWALLNKPTAVSWTCSSYIKPPHPSQCLYWWRVSVCGPVPRWTGQSSITPSLLFIYVFPFLPLTGLSTCLNMSIRTLQTWIKFHLNTFFFFAVELFLCKGWFGTAAKTQTSADGRIWPVCLLTVVGNIAGSSGLL